MESEQSSEIKNPKVESKFKLYAILTVLVIGAIVFGLQYLKGQKKLQDLENKLKISEEIIKNVKKNEALNSGKDTIESVKKLVILPNNENPTIATVNDLEKLKGQPFFQNAQVGDKVLIFTESKKAILYRPSENKVVELAPLNNSASSTEPAVPKIKK